MLRPYQEEALRAILENRRLGINRQLLVLATGGGKTVIASHLPEVLGMKKGGQLLFLVHRDELVFQAFEKFKYYNPELKVEIEKAEYRADPNSDVVIASVQSIGREGSPRLTKFDPDRFRYVVNDEAHHLGLGKQYWTVLKHLRAMKGEPDCDNSKLVLGITATPNRADKIGLEKIFDRIVYDMGIRPMVEQGWLADIVAYRVWTEHDISEVHTRSGDFAINELEESTNTPKRNALVAQKYIELGKSLPGLAFTVSIQHSIDLAETLNKHGVSAVALSGNTPDKERRAAIDAFKDNKINVLTSCGIFSEGADFPNATVGLMARPTKSQLLYIQQSGRVLRPYPAPEAAKGWDGYRKEQAILIDFVDNSGRHQLINTATIFGLRPEFDLKGKSVIGALEAIEELEREYPRLNLRNCVSLNEVKAIVEKIDLLRAPTVPAEAKRYSRYAWLEQSQDVYVLGLPDRAAVTIRMNLLGQREVWLSRNGVRSLHSTCEELGSAFRVADSQVPTDAIRLVLSSAKWREQEPTEKQVGALFKWDRNLKRQFNTAEDLYHFSLLQYRAGNPTFSKGGISDRLNELTATARRNPYYAKPR